MMNSGIVVKSLSSSDLRSATRELVRRSSTLEAELLAHIGEIDERKLYLDWAFPSMFAYCVSELGFSEDAACNRINVARAARQRPAILEALRSGQVHLAGLRLLAPHLTAENQDEVLAAAAGKSKRISSVAYKSEYSRMLVTLSMRLASSSTRSESRSTISVAPCR